MQHETNEQGQLLIYLTQDEWEDYGRQAGYYPEIIKEASADTEVTEEVTEEVTVESLKEQVASLQEEIKQIKTASAPQPSKVGEPHAFNENNYPNLVAEQEQDGLIGIFAPRP